METNKVKTADLDFSLIEEFKNQIRGEVVLPQDSDYNESRKVYNGMIDRNPGIIAKCVDVTDVINAVNFGRNNNLLVMIYC